MSFQQVGIILVFYILTSKGGEEDDNSKDEKDESVDLEEFFQKKNK